MKINKMQEQYDNMDNPAYHDEYQSSEDREFEDQVDFQEKLIIENINDDASLAIEALALYLKNYLENSTDDVDFMINWKCIIKHAQRTEGLCKQQSLTDEVSKAIRFYAEKLAREQ